jgi:hypothetical protein
MKLVLLRLDVSSNFDYFLLQYNHFAKMSKRPVVIKEKPKKPLTHYFLFRAERLQALKDQDNKIAIIKQEWDALSGETKEMEKEKYKKEMEKYNLLLAEWRKGHPDEPKEKSKKKGKKDDDDEEEEKVEKTKGAPKVLAKGKGRKEEEVKPEKGKSKVKGEAEGKSKRTKK